MINWLVRRSKIYKDLEKKHNSQTEMLDLLYKQKLQKNTGVSSSNAVLDVCTSGSGSITLSPGVYQLQAVVNIAHNSTFQPVITKSNVVALRMK